MIMKNKKINKKKLIAKKGYKKKKMLLKTSGYFPADTSRCKNSCH